MDSQYYTDPSYFKILDGAIFNPKKQEIEEKCEKSLNFVKSLTEGLTDKETIDCLTSAINRDKASEEMVCVGMVSVILTEPKTCEKVYQDLRMLNRDGFQCIVQHLNTLILQNYSSLQDSQKHQVFWLVREMVRNMITGVDGLCWNLMRNAASGDLSPRNLHLVDSLIDLYQENRRWLENFPLLTACVVYSYLRLIEDHTSSLLGKLRQREVSLVISLLRERFNDCLVIGRDLVRLLQNVARIPEFEAFWKDMLYTPTTLSVNFTGILQLLQSHTSRRFYQARLTPDMERKIVFFTSNVRFGSHKRYQEWFQKQYLATPESQTLRSDLIRFIVRVIHPSNELLCSDVIPRWAVIGWLITSCTSNVALANAKLALFYDWLFFQHEDNIMNIEPAILIMTNSMRTHPAVTASLLDFLCRIISNYYPPLTEKIRSGVHTSLYHILEKRVLPTLLPLFENPKLDRELRNMIRENFFEFCEPMPIEGPIRFDDPFKEEFHNNGNPKLEPCFSDEEGDPPPKPACKTENPGDPPPAKVKLKPKILQDIPLEAFRSLKKELRTTVQRLHNEAMNSRKCDIMREVLEVLLATGDFNSDTISNFTLTLHAAIRTSFEEKLLPQVLTAESVEESLRRPCFKLFEYLTEVTDSEKKRILCTVIAEFRPYQPKIGYHFLYYLKASDAPKVFHDPNYKINHSQLSLYKEVCVARNKKFEECLVSDLQVCQEEEVHLFLWLIPTVYFTLPKFTLNNEKLLHLVVGAVDARQLHDLIALVLQGQLTMLDASSFVSLASCSLKWETFEQYCFWHLAIAHDISVERMLTCLPKLEYKNHSEPLTILSLLLKRERPRNELLKPLFCREVKPISDLFVQSILQSWCNQNSETLADAVSHLLSSRCPQVSPTKRKRGHGQPPSQSQGLGCRTASPPSAERILSHLDRVRESCKDFLKEETMRKSLKLAQSACTDSQRECYSKLFELIEDEKDQHTSNNSKQSANAVIINNNKQRSSQQATNAVINNNKQRSSRRLGASAMNSNSSSGSTGTSNSGYLSKHRNAGARANLKDLSDSSLGSGSEEEEEEVFVKPKNAKRRRRITSDSD